MITEHRPTPALLAKFRRSFFISGALAALVVGLLAVGFREPDEPLWPPLVGSMVIILIIAWALRKTFAKQLRIQGSLNIVMDEAAITRYQESRKPLTIPLGEVTRVLESPGRWIRVYGPRSQQQITAVAELSDYALLRERIAGVRAPEPYAH